MEQLINLLGTGIISEQFYIAHLIMRLIILFIIIPGSIVFDHTSMTEDRGMITAITIVVGSASMLFGIYSLILYIPLLITLGILAAIKYTKLPRKKKRNYDYY